MKKFNSLIIIAIFLVVSFLLYHSRQIFFFNYDSEYYENLYFNSQWNVPLSTRGISDGDLYKFIGFSLAQGQNPFDLNYEVPPFVKHLYGVAEKTTGNPYWVSLGFYILTALGVYWLSQLLLKNSTISLLAILLFVSTPFVGTQIKETMLDLPLTCLFLYQAFFFIRFLQKNKTLDLILAGLFLGLATGTKIGIYSPFIFLLGLLLVIISSRKILAAALYFFSTIAGYVLSYLSYFLHHPNPLPWLRLHEKPINFYLHASGGNVDYLNQWKGIFLNSYQGFWFGAGSGSLGDWSLLLPLGVLAAIMILVKQFKNKDLTWLYLTFMAFIFLTVNTFIPFFPRYLMPTIPLFIIFICYLLRRHSIWLVILAALSFVILFQTFIYRNLPGHIDAITRFLDTRAYRELYRSVDSSTRKNFSEKDFQSSLENFYETLGVKTIKVDINHIEDTPTSHRAQITTEYESNFGHFIYSREMTFVIEHNQWKIKWDWSLIQPGFDPLGDMKVEPGHLPVTKLTKEDQIRAVRGPWKAVYVIPRLMYDWGSYLDKLSLLTTLDHDRLNQRLRAFIPDDFPRFVGYLDPSLSEEEIAKNTLPGVRFKEAEFYVPLSAYRQDKSLFKDLLRLQSEHPEYFYLNGNILFKDRQGHIQTLKSPGKTPDNLVVKF